MPIEVGVWRIDGDVIRVPSSVLANENRLEEILESDISILGLDIVLIVGRQVITAFGKRIDLLAIDAQGQLYVIELKRDRTPRDVIAQALDYGSWVAGLTLDDVRNIYMRYRPAEAFDDTFQDRLGTAVPDQLASSHQLIIVASALDASTERIVSYLSTYGVPLNVVFFSYFRDGDHEYLTRSWLIDPVEAETRVARARPEGPRVSRVTGTWNGQDFYVSLGEGEHRNWDDCVKYGFVSGGQGRWYSQTLQTLFPGARVFTYIPQVGYVGVGTVVETATPVNDFEVEIDGRRVPILEVNDLKAPRMDDHADDPDLSEYLVRIAWLRTRPRDAAFQERGLFANQNTVCKLRDESTIHRLTEAFDLAE